MNEETTIWDEVRQRWQRDLPAVIEGNDPLDFSRRRENGLEPIGSIAADLVAKIDRARKGRAA